MVPPSLRTITSILLIMSSIYDLSCAGKRNRDRQRNRDRDRNRQDKGDRGDEDDKDGWVTTAVSASVPHARQRKLPWSEKAQVHQVLLCMNGSEWVACVHGFCRRRAIVERKMDVQKARRTTFECFASSDSPVLRKLVIYLSSKKVLFRHDRIRNVQTWTFPPACCSEGNGSWQEKCTKWFLLGRQQVKILHACTSSLCAIHLALSVIVNEFRFHIAVICYDVSSGARNISACQISSLQSSFVRLIRCNIKATTSFDSFEQ